MDWPEPHFPNRPEVTSTKVQSWSFSTDSFTSPGLERNKSQPFTHLPLPEDETSARCDT